METNKLYCLDNIVGMNQLESDSVDLTVTSPPYDGLRDYNGYSFDFENVAKQLFRITSVGGIVVWVVGDTTLKGSETLTSFRQALFFKEIGFNVHDTMIYEKTGVLPTKNRYIQSFEYMFVLSKGKPKTTNLIKDRKNNWGGHKTFGKASFRNQDGTLSVSGQKEVAEYGYRMNIWRITNGFGFGQSQKEAYKHPATFPEKLAEDHILSWSNEGDLVLDPFVGSGTTVRMAKKNKRRYVGFDISQEYVDLSNILLEKYE